MLHDSIFLTYRLNCTLAFHEHRSYIDSTSILYAKMSVCPLLMFDLYMHIWDTSLTSYCPRNSFHLLPLLHKCKYSCTYMCTHHNLYICMHGPMISLGTNFTSRYPFLIIQFSPCTLIILTIPFRSYPSRIISAKNQINRRSFNHPIVSNKWTVLATIKFINMTCSFICTHGWLKDLQFDWFFCGDNLYNMFENMKGLDYESLK